MSECQLTDLDVVYVKDTEVPESERLWRYAIKNRKRTEGELWERSNHVAPIPSIRSNEAIYLGLRKRKDERDKKRRRRKESDKESRIKRRHSCEHLQKIKSMIQVRKASKAPPSGRGVTPLAHVTKTRRTPSSQSQHQVNLHQQFINPTMSAPITHQGWVKKEAGVPRTMNREGVFSPWGHDEAWSDRSKIATVKCKQRFESKKSLYNSVIKRRLNCGSQLESFNNDIINKKNCPRSVLSKETRRKYGQMKGDYLNLCYQEATLRHQISLINAEIYMMQNKGYHKTPASIKTITLDPSYTPLHRSQSLIVGHVTDDSSLPMFPCLKAPRPLITSQQRLNFEKQTEKMEKRRSAVQGERKVEMHEPVVKTTLPRIDGWCAPAHGVCSIYSISPHIATQPREPFTLPEKKVEKLIHRLPKMAVEVNTSTLEKKVVKLIQRLPKMEVEVNASTSEKKVVKLIHRLPKMEVEVNASNVPRLRNL